jgi:hypothetical protein
MFWLFLIITSAYAYRCWTVLKYSLQKPNQTCSLNYYKACIYIVDSIFHEAWNATPDWITALLASSKKMITALLLLSLICKGSNGVLQFSKQQEDISTEINSEPAFNGMSEENPKTNYFQLNCLAINLHTSIICSNSVCTAQYFI